MGSQNNDAADEANRQEQARQAAIRATQAQVNRVFDAPGREADIVRFIQDLRAYYGRDLDQKKADTDRSLKFALARAGQIGGSTQIDQQREFAKQYTRGLLDVAQRAEGAGANLRAADQDARARLISLATSGLDATTGAAQAAAALRSNIESSSAAARAEGIGNVFGQFADFANRRREEADRLRGLRESGFTLYAPSGAAPGGF